MLTTAAVILAGLYGFLAFLFLIGTFRKQGKREERPQLPFISVVIAAKEEQRNIGRCLDSLLKQDYPEDRFEIIVVDDCSEDHTPEIVKSYTGRSPEVALVRVNSTPKRISGKQYALAIGVEKSRGEIILTTDANCVAPREWVRETAAHFSPEVGLVAGFTLVETNGLFARLQCLDLLYLLTIGWGAVGMGRPTSGMGKNLGFRRQAYEEVGGYRNLGFALNEDLALLGAIRDTRHWDIRFIPEPSVATTASPAKGFSEFLAQRKRWTLAGLKRIPFFARLVLVTAFCSRLLVLLLLLLSPLKGGCLKLAGGVFLATTLSDFLLLCRSVVHLKRKDLVKYLPIVFPFQLFYQLVVGTLVLLGKREIHWKGRKYDGRRV